MTCRYLCPCQLKSDCGRRNGVRQKFVRAKPHNLQKTKSATSNSVSPNMFRSVHLLMLISVTSVGVERADLVIKLVKTVMRGTVPQDRLNALVLLNVHKEILLDIQSNIDKYSRKHPRRRTVNTINTFQGWLRPPH